jgi:hypothetical protein
MIKCRLDVFKSKDRRNDFREEIEIFLPKEPIRERLLLLPKKSLGKTRTLVGVNFYLKPI